MPTETTDFIAGLDQSRPQGSESLSEADDHLRLIKKSITSTFVGADGNFYDKPVTAGPDDLNAIPGRWGDTVNRTTDQTVGGVKHFTDEIKAGAGVVDAAGKNLIERAGVDVIAGSADAATFAMVSQGSEGLSHVYNDGANEAKVLTVDNIVELMVDLFYPVDFIIHGGPDPSIRFPMTTWAQIEARVIMGTGTGTDDNGNELTVANRAEGGEYTHQLTVGEMPPHTHSYKGNIGTKGSAGTNAWLQDNGNNTQTSSTGGNAYHNNVQPYRAAYIWQRTA